MPIVQHASDSLMALARWRYVAAFAITQMLLAAALLVVLLVAERSMPAPYMSVNESFNEKARWLREHAAAGCDVLMVGSSMALNNLDSGIIARVAGANSVINAGAWGLSMSDTAKMTGIVAPLCKPRVIVVAAYYGDFEGNFNTQIDWDLAKKYIAGGNATLIYLRTMDPIYYGSKYLGRKYRAYKGNARYESLHFDDSGSVILDCMSFEIDPRRWNGYIHYQPLSAQSVKLNLEGLAVIEGVAKTSGSRLLFVLMPLRPVAELRLATPEISGLWAEVGRSVRNAGGAFMRLRATHDFQDGEFADFAHLNGCGASTAAEDIGTEVGALLQGPR